MRRTLGIWLVLVWFAHPAVSRQSAVATIEPAKPRLGQSVVFIYDAAARGALLKNTTSMIAEVMILGDEEPVVIEPAMKKSGTTWKGSFVLKQKGAQLILYRFRSGESLDDNGENTWRALVFGEDGRPVRGAYIASATFHQYANFRGFKSQKDPQQAQADLDQELKLYPDNWRVALARWGFMRSSATSEPQRSAILKELQQLYHAHQDDEEAVAQFLTWYERLGEKQRADSIRASIVARDPKGKVAEAAAQDRIYQERDPATRVRLIEDFLNSFPQEGPSLEAMQTQLFAFSSRMNDHAKAESVLATMEHPSGQMYNSLAWPLIEKGENLEQAVAWAKKGLDLLDPGDLSKKPAYVTTADWKKNTQYGRGMVLDTYGFGLIKLGRLADAERAFVEALALMDYQDPDVNERAVECMVQVKHYQKAIDVSLASISRGKANDKLMEYQRTAYVALHGSEEGLQESIQQARDAAREAMAKRLQEERINKPAIDFALKSLDGSTVRLSDLRGKIVVIDFWATWCGPCVQSFPYLQKVYEKHKLDKDIMILAVDTWESKTGKELEDQVRDFISKNKYTFPVLFDQGFVEKYGVEGIPTKFIIDQKGRIQFKDIGFGGGEEMMQRMDMQFELLRKSTL